MQEYLHKSQYDLVDNHQLSELLGRLDENLKLIEKTYDVRLKVIDGSLEIYGKDIESISAVKALLEKLSRILSRQRQLSIKDLEYVMNSNKDYPNAEMTLPSAKAIIFSATGKAIRPKTIGQNRYVESIQKNDIVFGIGPAGTGKTYLAMAMAIKAFKEKEVARIVLTRPAVEAGENLGFLPGDMQMKVDPYLRPLYDAVFDMLGPDMYQKMLERNVIEVAPLAYMRGRTIDNAYIILDEAQNTTNEQMKMFLTRLGQGSKAIITGDITQIDLVKGKKSGLVTVSEILKDIEGIEFIYLNKADIVRHRVVQRIIEAYERAESTKE